MRRPAFPVTWRYWAAPAVWIILNFIVSTDLFSAEHTGTMLARLLAMLHLHTSNLVLLNAIARKLGHFSAYGVLSWLIFRSWRQTLPERRVVTATDGRSGRTIRAFAAPLWTLRWSVLSVALCVMWAALDEFHQSFVLSRTSSAHDVLLDSLGAIFMQVVLMVLLLEKTRPVKDR